MTESIASKQKQLPSRRGRKKDPNKLKSIIETASGHFVSYGYHGASLLEIAKVSNVSRVTIYSYFPSKRHLFEACLQAKVDLLFPAFNKPAIDFSQPAEVLTKVGKRILAVLRDELILATQRMMFGLVPPLYEDTFPKAQKIGLKLAHSPNSTELSEDVLNQEKELREIRQMFLNMSVTRALKQFTYYLQEANKRNLLVVHDAEYSAQLYLSLFQDFHYYSMLMGLTEPPSREQDIAFLEKNVQTFLKLYEPSKPLPEYLI